MNGNIAKKRPPGGGAHPQRGGRGDKLRMVPGALQGGAPRPAAHGNWDSRRGQHTGSPVRTEGSGRWLWLVLAGAVMLFLIAVVVVLLMLHEPPQVVEGRKIDAPIDNVIVKKAEGEKDKDNRTDSFFSAYPLSIDDLIYGGKKAEGEGVQGAKESEVSVEPQDLKDVAPSYNVGEKPGGPGLESQPEEQDGALQGTAKEPLADSKGTAPLSFADEVTRIAHIVSQAGIGSPIDRQLAGMIVLDSERLGFEPLLIAAYMNEVSSFTWSGGEKSAVGLFAISPRRAEAMALKAQVAWGGLNELRNPSYNLRLGLNYWDYLRRRYRGDPDKILTAMLWGEANMVRALKREIQVPQQIRQKVESIKRTFVQWQRVYPLS